MTYNSLAFALFLPLCLLPYLAVARNRRWAVIACASGAFVVIGQPVGIVLIGLATIVAYLAGLAIAGVVRGVARRVALVAAIVLLVGELGATKYAGVSGIVPLGISFYTLRLSGYLIDVYFARIPPERNLGVLVAYAAFFPEFQAGPVDRAGALIPQLRNPRPFSEATASKGLKRFAWGLLKKAVVADQLGILVNSVFAAPTTYSGISLSVAAILFAFQIYYDFSSYSDMAIGVGEILGLRLATNFDRPYSAKSISEFWRRWHITFSSWLRDYIFLPLAYSASRWAENLEVLRRPVRLDYATYALATMVTMILGGMWHGVGWTFAAWGALIGMYMVVGRLTKQLRARVVKKIGLKAWPRTHGALQVATVFVLMDVAWIFFRAASISDAVYILGHLSSGIGAYVSTIVATPVTRWYGKGFMAPFSIGQPAAAFLQCWLGIVAIETLHLAQRKHGLYGRLMKWPGVARWGIYSAVVLLILLFGASDSRTFIYAQF